jgi:hypothetical protein
VKVPCPLFKTVEAAAARGLDFIAISDHNSISQYNDMRELQPYFDRLLLMPSREITTFDGHGNVFGTTDYLEFRLTSRHLPSINDLLRQVQQKHAIFSINHPDAPTGAKCMGCGWSAPNTDYHLVTAIEAINGGSLDGPDSGIPFWQARLNEGYRLTGIGGSDNHDADIPPAGRNAVGHPTTVVYAANLSERAILDGIKAGHVFIDIDGTRDRGIEFTAESGEHTASMGDALAAPKGTQVHFGLKLLHLEGAHPEVICDGQKLASVNEDAIGQALENRSFTYASDGKRHWVRVNVRAADGRLLILGNPIYLNY